MSYALRTYKASRTSNASREDLLILLYEGAIRFLEQSIQESEQGRLSRHKELLQRGVAIIAELQNTLDFQKGGELAIQLFELYGFMLEHLTQANLIRDTDYIQVVVNQLNTLLEGWRVAVKQVKEGKASLTPAARPPVAANADGGERPRFARSL
jgi:flagellar protein FliS